VIPVWGVLGMGGKVLRGGLADVGDWPCLLENLDAPCGVPWYSIKNIR
jgi:hypothetical protein